MLRTGNLHQRTWFVVQNAISCVEVDGLHVVTPDLYAYTLAYLLYDQDRLLPFCSVSGLKEVLVSNKSCLTCVWFEAASFYQ